MRLGLVILLSLAVTGCAIWRKDKEEPVESRQEREKAEEVLKPSEVLKPEGRELASPISDRFYLRLTAFQSTAETTSSLSETHPPDTVVPPGTLLLAEEDLGFDDVLEQARIEFDFRLKERNHLRVDYFKSNRFGEVVLDRPISYGDFDFQTGDVIRSKLDWRVLSLTYTYSLLKAERFEAGVGIGLHIIEAKSELGEPGTINFEEFSEVAPFATAAVNAAFRISKRWAVTARGQSFEYNDGSLTGRMSDFHADIQYRWRKNFVVGIGYTKLRAELQADADGQDAFFDMSNVGPELFFRASF